MVFAYAKKYSEDILYYSDSNQKLPCPCRFLDDPNVHHIQLLIHPLWWQIEEKNVSTLINRVIRGRQKTLKSWFLAHNQVYLNNDQQNSAF